MAAKEITPKKRKELVDMFGEETIEWMEMDGTIKVTGKQGSESVLEKARSQMAETREVFKSLKKDLTPTDTQRASDLFAVADGLQISRDKVQQLIEKFDFQTVEQMLSVLAGQVGGKERRTKQQTEQDRMRQFLGLSAASAKPAHKEYSPDEQRAQVRSFLFFGKGK